MLGVLGGMGPAATLDFLNKVIANTPARRDQDHIRMHVSFATDVPDRSAAILGQGEDPLPALRKALRALARPPISLIAIPCNTAHRWYDDLQAQTATPILHMADAVADVLPIATQRVGILATTGTIRAGIYQDRLSGRGIRCLFPAESGQTEIMSAIALVKGGDVASGRAIFLDQVMALNDAGCDAIIMACTEIPVALAGATLDRPNLVDPTEVLARAAVDFFLSKRIDGSGGETPSRRDPAIAAVRP